MLYIYVYFDKFSIIYAVELSFTSGLLLYFSYPSLFVVFCLKLYSTSCLWTVIIINTLPLDFSYHSQLAFGLCLSFTPCFWTVVIINTLPLDCSYHSHLVFGLCLSFTPCFWTVVIINTLPLDCSYHSHLAFGL